MKNYYSRHAGMTFGRQTFIIYERESGEHAKEIQVATAYGKTNADIIVTAFNKTEASNYEAARLATETKTDANSCGSCNGTGRWFGSPCHVCDGTGVL